MPTGMAPEATRGVSDSAAALVASSINGGGCLPPPTPAEKIAETLGKHMERAVNPEPTNYSHDLRNGYPAGSVNHPGVTGTTKTRFLSPRTC